VEATAPVTVFDPDDPDDDDVLSLVPEEAPEEVPDVPVCAGAASEESPPCALAVDDVDVW
jgi:hypothetical protein